VQTYPIPVYVPLNDAQLALLEQSYTELKQSIGDGLVLQTRLKGYMDAIALQIDANGIKLDFAGVEALLANRQATDAKAVSRESRRWRDAAAGHPAHYRFRHIDMACLRSYPDGIHFKTCGHAGKQTSRTRESHSGAIRPAPALGMETNAMQRTAARKHPGARNATSESRRWRVGDPCANGEWRRVA
jgi:hypothetical protein